MKKVWHCEHPELSELYTRSEASADSLKQTGYTVTRYVAVESVDLDNFAMLENLLVKILVSSNAQVWASGIKNSFDEAMQILSVQERLKAGVQAERKEKPDFKAQDHVLFDLHAARNGDQIEYFCTTGWVPCTFVGLSKNGIPIVEYHMNNTDSIAYVVWERNLRMAVKKPSARWYCRHYIVRGLPSLFASHQPAPHDYLEEDGARWHGEPFIIEVFEDTK